MKGRILHLFDELLPFVVEVAKTPTLKVLTENYMDVQIEIREQLRKNPDPLKTAEDAILVGHEEAERQIIAQRRKEILERLGAVFDASRSELTCARAAGAGV